MPRVMICYDVGDDRRRYKVAKLLEANGRRLQRSVFECNLSRSGYWELVSGLRKIMKEKEDCCMFVPICTECGDKVQMFGNTMEEEFKELIIA